MQDSTLHHDKGEYSQTLTGAAAGGLLKVWLPWSTTVPFSEALMTTGCDLCHSSAAAKQAPGLC